MAAGRRDACVNREWASGSRLPTPKTEYGSPAALTNHDIFGVGLYAAALMSALLFANSSSRTL
jgi:hypothetical protein